MRPAGILAGLFPVAQCLDELRQAPVPPILPPQTGGGSIADEPFCRYRYSQAQEPGHAKTR
ncbi:hypothetical protein CNECB9_1860003 [Cupriavidus necator]|uniref:Uncharacterized protein n=1 Tax=Cupriavidus necator TaxID=106590 RepID=A0A1K0ICG7_CUPNE|nr:hypothetical protein CNECB9_1860003 [Cupriavidus necator]